MEFFVAGTEVVSSVCMVQLDVWSGNKYKKKCTPRAYIRNWKVMFWLVDRDQPKHNFSGGRKYKCKCCLYGNVKENHKMSNKLK